MNLTVASPMENRKPKKHIFRTIVETGFIIFLFYSNLLMGEYDKMGNGQKHGFLNALNDIFTTSNFIIGLFAAIIGYIVFEFLRKRF